MKIVEEYKIGNTQVKIYGTAYASRTRDEIEKSLAKIADIARNGLMKEAKAS